MVIRVKLYGTLRRFSQPGTPGVWQGEIPPGARIIDLIELIGSTEREVSAVSLDGTVQPFETVIPDGVTDIKLVTPIGGG
jgi:sulfur carrier protein ThiS